VLETDAERTEFKSLFQRCQDELRPEGLLEKVLMEEIAITLWKLRITIRLESKELSLSQEDLRDPIGDVFHSDLELPISDWDLVDKGWNCERIIVRAVAGKDVIYSTASRGPTVYQGKVLDKLLTSRNQNSQQAGHLEVEAVLVSSLDKLTRYQSALRRDLYRAIETLRSLQVERRHREGPTSNRSDRGTDWPKACPGDKE
jgi:hypothetical protein